MNDIVKAIIALGLVGLALTLVHRCAQAGEWFPEAAIFADVTTSDGVYCHDSDNQASHLGARVDIWADGPHRVRTLWIHNSCVQEEHDRRDRNVIGVGYEYRLW